MFRFILRRLGFMLLTMFLVSVVIFLVSEVAPGDVARHILGQFATDDQVKLLRQQMGLEQPLYVRYFDWLVGNEWRLRNKVDMPLVYTKARPKDEIQWWAEESDGTLVQWKYKTSSGSLEQIRIAPDDSREVVDFEGWKTRDDGSQYFWGVDTAGHVVLWVKNVEGAGSGPAAAGRSLGTSGGQEYYPLKKGLLRGDPGISLRTNRPVGPTLARRLRNSFSLALIAFLLIMPIALALGILAGLREGSALDRSISLFSLITTSVPEFASGVFLILVLSFWLDLLPGASVFVDDTAPLQQPKLIILPVLTLTLAEVGYVARMTRASMVEVMNAPYIRTAILKGLPYRRIVFRHALRNALMAPITVIMLHVNWLVGGIVVVEAVFGYPGLGLYMLDSALFKDVNAIEAGAMVMVALAVGTQLIADIIYTFLNPRIRFT
ncbi:MAG: ABC transporter permease [Chloroflexi bacterium]|nr:ABC transporter permease [Chloroflexota bacterium]